jgi:hypothetical protein
MAMARPPAGHGEPAPPTRKLMMNIRLIAGLLALGMAWPQAAAAEPEAPLPTVSVSGTRDPDLKTYKAFLAGIDAFDAHHALAPDARLQFLLTARDPGFAMSGLTMHIQADDLKIAVPVAPDGHFAMPRNAEAAQKDAEVILNKKRGALRWRPDIRSPGVPAGMRRLGDLRLECEVLWAVEKMEMPSFQRVFINAFNGPCKTSAVHTNYVAPRPVRAVTLVSGTRHAHLDEKWIEDDGRMYVPPLHDASWPDDTLLEFDFLP